MCDSLSLCHTKSLNARLAGDVRCPAEISYTSDLVLQAAPSLYSYPDNISGTSSVFYILFGLILDLSSFNYALVNSSHLFICCGLLLGWQTCFVPLNSCHNPVGLQFWEQCGCLSPCLDRSFGAMLGKAALLIQSWKKGKKQILMFLQCSQTCRKSVLVVAFQNLLHESCLDLLTQNSNFSSCCIKFSSYCWNRKCIIIIRRGKFIGLLSVYRSETFQLLLTPLCWYHVCYFF